MSDISNVHFGLNDPNGANVEITTVNGNSVKLYINGEASLTEIYNLFGSGYRNLIGVIIDSAVEGTASYSQPTLFDADEDKPKCNAVYHKPKCNAVNPCHCSHDTMMAFKPGDTGTDEFDGNYTVDEFRELLGERRNASTLVNGVSAVDSHYSSYFDTFRDAATAKPKLRVSFVYVDRAGKKTTPVLTLIDDENPGDENGFYVRNADDEIRRYNFDGIKSAKVKVEEI